MGSSSSCCCGCSRCGCCCGKKKADHADEEAKEEEEERVYDTSKIFWDDFGNLRYGEEHPVTREKQMQQIMELDFVDDTQSQEWYIMDAAWINSWLAFVHTQKHVAPAPGPCDNRRLIVWNADNNTYMGRFGLQMGTKDKGGDYRRVSRATWMKYLEFYPSSGPAITMDFDPSKKVEGGWYDTCAGFNILNPPAPPQLDSPAKKKKKHRKKKNKNDGDDTGTTDALVQGEEGADANVAVANGNSSSGVVGMGGDFEDRKADSDDDEIAPDEIGTVNSATGVPIIKTKNEPRINYQKLNRQSEDARASGSGEADMRSVSTASREQRKYEALIPTD